MLAPLARVLMVCAVVVLAMASSFRCSYGDDAALGDRDFDTSLTLRDSLGLPRSEFRAGETVVFELQVRNRAASSRVIQFQSTRQFDFVVLDASSSNKRWQWSEGRAFAPAITELRFAPQEIKSFRFEWNQLTASGAVLDVGNYRARGVLVFDGFDADPLRSNSLGSDPKTFAIRL